MKQGVEFAISLEQFELRLSGIETVSWQRLQAQVPQTTRAYADLCCVLAYLGVDYCDNVARLQRPICREGAGDHTGVSMAEPACYSLADLPGYLSLLFRKRHDATLLNSILSMDVCEPAVFAAYTDTVAYLWDEDAPALLACAAGCPAKTAALASMLREVCRLLGTEEIGRLYLDRLRRAHDESDAQTSIAARELLQTLEPDL
jgi:hypothetical protein